jgi:hypothetical protein
MAKHVACLFLPSLMYTAHRTEYYTTHFLLLTFRFFIDTHFLQDKRTLAVVDLSAATLLTSMNNYNYS